jgi:signal peptidase I
MTTTAPGDAVDAAAAPAVPAKKRSTSREVVVLVVIALALALVVKTFLVQAFFIPSGSMETTLHGCDGCNGDRVLVNKVVYKVRDIRRGEIVVFNGDGIFPAEAEVPEAGGALRKAVRSASRLLGLGAPGEKDYIKRVIGLPGDRVACCSNGHVTVQPAGSDVPVELDEPYLYEDNRRPFCEAGTDADCPPSAPGRLVPEGELWVMGDHRGASSDSRDNGTIPVDRVIGRAFVVVWPPTRVKPLPVPEITR